MSSQSDPELGTDYFGRGHWLAPLQQRVSLAARKRMFETWSRFMTLSRVRPGKLLDVGSTPDTSWTDSNCMIPWFQSAGWKVALYSPEDISNLARVFRDVTILPSRPAGSPFPADDQEYDSVVASAVLEHVGSRRAQVEFIRECGRSGRSIFLTTPNRGHWLEFHTKVPLLHWLPRKAHYGALRSLGLSKWASESMLRLVSRSELAELAREALGESFDLRIETVWSLGAPSNLVLLAIRR